MLSALPSSLSPAELSYLRTSLSQRPSPLRPDGRPATTLRPLAAETGILPSSNGSARVVAPDGAEALCGVRAELERIPQPVAPYSTKSGSGLDSAQIAVSIDAPSSSLSTRDADASPSTAALAAVLADALALDPHLPSALAVSACWRWSLALDVLLLAAPPTAAALPLLSLAVHLALRDTCLPRNRAENPSDDDPLFARDAAEDWDDAALPLYPSGPTCARPPLTFVVAAIGGEGKMGPGAGLGAGGRGGGGRLGGAAGSEKGFGSVEGHRGGGGEVGGAVLIMDPDEGEGSVAEGGVAVSVLSTARVARGARGRRLRVLAVRSLDFGRAVWDVRGGGGTGWGGGMGVGEGLGKGVDGVIEEGKREMEKEKIEEGECAPRGGMRREALRRMVELVVRKGGVAEELFDALEGLGVGA